MIRFSFARTPQADCSRRRGTNTASRFASTSKRKRPADIVVIQGKKETNDFAVRNRQRLQQLIAIVEEKGIDVATFGGGRKPLSLRLMKEIRQSGVVGPDTHVALFAHGGVNPMTKRHEIDGVPTTDLLKPLVESDQNDSSDVEGDAPSGSRIISVCESGALVGEYSRSDAHHFRGAVFAFNGGAPTPASRDCDRLERVSDFVEIAKTNNTRMHPIHLYTILGEGEGEQVDALGGGELLHGARWPTPENAQDCRTMQANAMRMRRAVEVHLGARSPDDADHERVDSATVKRRLQTAVAGLLLKGDVRAVTAFFDQSPGLAAELDSVSCELFCHASVIGAPMVEALIAQGLDLDARNQFGESALLLSAHSGEPSAVKTLIRRGADLDARDKRGRTLVHLAARNPDPQMLRLVLSRDDETSVDVRDNDGATALHLATSDTCRDLLLAKGASVDAQTTSSGETPLMTLCGSDASYSTLKTAIDRAERLDTRDNEGRTALDHAVAARTADAICLLLEKESGAA
jgi:hypothetical protein